jgi:hypothetical protein
MKAPARAVTVISTALVLLVGLATPALADGPATDAWPDGKDRSALDDIVFFGGCTLGLIVVISLFALLTARHNYTPPPPSADLEKAPGSEAVQH